MLDILTEALRNSILITGLVVVLMMLAKEIAALFELVKRLFDF